MLDLVLKISYNFKYNILYYIFGRGINNYEEIFVIIFDFGLHYNNV